MLPVLWTDILIAEFMFFVSVTHALFIYVDVILIFVSTPLLSEL